MKYLKPYNESVKDYLKPKSEEDIKKSIMNSSIIRKFELIHKNNLRHLFTDEEYKEIILHMFYENPSYFFSYFFKDYNLGYNNLSKILSEEQIKDGVFRYTKYLNDVIFNLSNENLNDIIYYLYKNDYLYDHVDNTNSMWFRHLTKGPYQGGHESISKYTKLQDVIDYVERMEKLNESIRQYLKPKSEEEINSSLNNLSPSEKILKGVTYNLMWLVKKGLDEGGDPSSSDNYAIRWASKNGYLEIVKLLLNDKRVDPSENKNQSIRFASRNGHTEIVKLLLNDDRVYPSDDHNYAIILSSAKGYIDIVKLIINHKKFKVDNQPIEYALDNKQFDIVKLLLNNKKFRNILSKEQIEKYEKQLQNLNESIKDYLKPKPTEELEKSIKKLNQYQKNRMLDDIIQSKFNLDLIELLLKNGANIEIIKSSPYHWWWRLGKHKDRKRLIDQYSKVEESIRQHLKPKPMEEILDKMKHLNLTPYKKFYKGCQFGILPLVKEAVEEGANPICERNVGIRMASSKGYLDVVKYLLSIIRVGPPYECIYDSIRNDHLEIVKLLLNDKRVYYEPEDNNFYLIHYCFNNKKYETLKILLDNAKNKNQWNGELEKYQKVLEEYEKNK